MPTRDDLKRKYGGKLRQAINGAIRAEVPGGAMLLDATAAAIDTSRGGVHPYAAALRDALPLLDAARDKLAEGVLRQYGGDQISEAGE